MKCAGSMKSLETDASLGGAEGFRVTWRTLGGLGSLPVDLVHL